MLQSRKQIAQKEKKIIFARDVVTKNSIFSKEHFEDFFQMFNLYCDSSRQCDISDLLGTARTLGFQRKYKLFFEALEAINKDMAGNWVGFQTLMKLITDKIGNPFSEGGRRSMFALVDIHNKDYLEFSDLKRISEQLKFNLNDEELQEVLNNVAGFGKKEITWDQFNKYIAKKVEKRTIQ